MEQINRFHSLCDHRWIGEIEDNGRNACRASQPIAHQKKQGPGSNDQKEIPDKKQSKCRRAQRVDRKKNE